MAGIPLGLLSDFGVKADIQTFIIVVMISVHSSIILIFENRYYIMFARDTKWKHFRKLFTAGNYIFASTYFIPALFNVPDQEIALKELHEMIPNLSPEISDSEIFVVATEFSLVVIPISIFVLVNAIEWYTLLTVLSRNMNNSIRLATHSENTMKLQKKFLLSMYIQATVFLVNIQVPVVYGLISQFTGYYNQAFNNLSFIFISLHGVSSTSVMIYVHKPYRDFISQLFGMAKNRIPRRPIVSVIISVNQG